MSEKWQVVRSSIIKQALYVEDVDTKDMVCLLPQGPEQADQRRAHRPDLIAASPEMLALLKAGRRKLASIFDACGWDHNHQQWLPEMDRVIALAEGGEK